MKKANNGETHAIRTKIKEAENRLTIIASTLKNLYEDKSAGKLPESVFLNLTRQTVRQKRTGNRNRVQIHKKSALERQRGHCLIS
jgi:hypothetical protein